MNAKYLAEASPTASSPAVELAALAGPSGPDTRPVALRATPAPACSVCGRGGVALAVVEHGGAEIGYCWRCYGVGGRCVEPTGALRSTWSPPVGEVYESRAEVGSFEPPPGERPPPATKGATAPARVSAQEWLAITGQVGR